MASSKSCQQAVFNTVLLLAVIGCSGKSDERAASPASVDESATSRVGPVEPAYSPSAPASAMEPTETPSEEPLPRMAASELPSAAAPRRFAVPPSLEAAPQPSPARASAPSRRLATESSPVRTLDAAAGRSSAPAMAEVPDHLRQLPAGASHDAEQGYATVQVFYATDRAQDPLPLSAYQLAGNKQLFLLLAGAALLFASFAIICLIRGVRGTGRLSAVAAGLMGVLSIGVVSTGQASIEKHGVTYNGDRGKFVRGISTVTVPDQHQRGVVERPSLLRFEFQEDQTEHVVLTSAVELTENEFRERLSRTVASSPQHDLLVFIHGYNVGFQAAVQRTAQISVDLPFEGVPVCYSWPSQGSLVGYPIDENNVAWTVTHLKEFLRELVTESGAQSVNLVAHSMGNRALTTALQQMRYEQLAGRDDTGAAAALFDRVVLAAPDVDADLFRRDLAPALVDLAGQVTLYASSDDRALIASKTVHGYPRAGESGGSIVVVPGVETIDVSGIDLSLLGHSYYGDSESMLRDLYGVIYSGLPASERTALLARSYGEMQYWQLLHDQRALR